MLALHAVGTFDMSSQDDDLNSGDSSTFRNIVLAAALEPLAPPMVSRIRPRLEREAAEIGFDDEDRKYLLNRPSSTQNGAKRGRSSGGSGTSTCDLPSMHLQVKK
mmetsp:Transcript_1316/g.4177  ORF Transcript_1316/g.4177 Transcript_1316/m.4177 type:complete len:105 (-) Transcript_1316:226-540(-)